MAEFEASEIDERLVAKFLALSADEAEAVLDLPDAPYHRYCDALLAGKTHAEAMGAALAPAGDD
jgi:hypothetical protein